MPRSTKGVVFPTPQHVRRSPCLFSANVGAAATGYLPASAKGAAGVSSQPPPLVVSVEVRMDNSTRTLPVVSSPKHLHMESSTPIEEVPMSPPSLRTVSAATLVR